MCAWQPGRLGEEHETPCVVGSSAREGKVRTMRGAAGEEGEVWR